MRPELEQHIKESIEEFEFPYDAKAWDRMKTTLDQRMPVKRTFPKTWLFGLGILAIGGIGVAVWQAQTQVPSPTHAKNIQQQLNPEIKEIPISNQPLAKQDNSIKPVPVSSTNKINQVITEQQNTPPVRSIEDRQDINALKVEAPVNEPIVSQPAVEISSTNPLTPAPEEMRPRVSLNSTMCAGEKQTLKNDNKQALIVSFPSGEQKIVEPNKSLDIQSIQSGIISVGYVKNGGAEILQTITLQQSPAVAFNYMETISYENGLPVMDFKTEEEENIEWRVNDKLYAKNEKQFNLHPFIKGSYTIELSKRHENGCTSSYTQTISIPESYNLMAANAFNPSSLDFRKSTFMPYALTQRNTPFTLTVIDATSGVVVFQTTDASTGWDGTDRQTGKPVESNKAFIWKVSLHKPEPGELSEYTGSITKL